jgi:hypothetical protein
MGEPARSTPTALPRLFLEHLDEKQRTRLGSRLDQVLRAARRTTPLLDSEDERTLVHEFTEVVVELTLSLGPRVLAAHAETDLAEQLDALLLEEYESVNTERKLAYHHVRKGVEVFGRLTQLFAAALRHHEALEDAFAEARNHHQPFLEVNCLLLALSAALDTSDADLEHFTHWARLAAIHSRRVEALLPELANVIEAAVSRSRARHAWDDWDDQETERELSEWKTLLD